ncbi:MAG TPA: protein-L-isoaspartate(D-aspartate) O-methyltransferase [Candidatus Altiarchaeales archaeon]|nr:protein-L-isoaspartate(D-aspartate) O-methyltransferase [Candidatus Altiarchaeales archaeon]
MNRKSERRGLIKKLKSEGYLSNERVIEAMLKVPREEFITEYQKSYAYADRPLPIGEGQTISAPHMVAIMTEHLDVEEDHKVLEIGAGSGYQAAILAEIANKGKIYTVERIPELAKKAEENLNRIGYKNIEIIISDGSKGYKKEAPYDRIIVTAGAPRIPESLLKQLKDPGKLLIPVGGRMFQELKLVEKKKGEFSTKNLGGCVFVPLIGDEGW